MAATDIKPMQPKASFFKNLRDEMEFFHNKLPKGDALEVVVSFNGHEYPVDTVVPIPPDILVCECQNGEHIVQHIFSVQLKFRRVSLENSAKTPEKLPIGFRASESSEQTQ